MDIILWTGQNGKYGHYFTDGGNSFNKYYLLLYICNTIINFFFKFSPGYLSFSVPSLGSATHFSQQSFWSVWNPLSVNFDFFPFLALFYSNTLKKDLRISYSLRIKVLRTPSVPSYLSRISFWVVRSYLSHFSFELLTLFSFLLYFTLFNSLNTIFLNLVPKRNVSNNMERRKYIILLISVIFCFSFVNIICLLISCFIYSEN